MPNKNIFAGFGARSEFVNLIYMELMKREFVSYADILALYCKRPKGYYEKKACNREPGYGELKKAFPEVLKALEKLVPDVLRTTGKVKVKHTNMLAKVTIRCQKSVERGVDMKYLDTKIGSSENGTVHEAEKL